MRLLLRIGDAVHQVELDRGPAGLRIAAAGRTLSAALPDPGRSDTPGSRAVVVELDGRPVRAVVVRDGRRWWVALGGEVAAVDDAAEDEQATGTAHGPLDVVSPIPGRVVKVLVARGDTVEAGQLLVSVEAMKMENGLRAERAGRVARVLVGPGDRVEPGQLLVELTEADPE